MSALDWRPLAETDPVPGDPELVRLVAAGYARVAVCAGDQAQAVRRVQQAVSGAGAVPWDGPAAAAFRSRLGSLPRDLDRIATRQHRVAMALGEFAPELESAQRQARRALARAHDAQQRAGVSAAAPFATTPVLLASTQTPVERELATEVARAGRMLAAAVERRDRAAARCVRAVHAAGDDALRDPHGWHRILQTVSAVAGQVSTWLGVAAVVLCWVPGLGQVLGAVALTAAGLALLADLALTRSGDKGWEDVVLDTTGVLPAGRALRLGSMLPREATQVRAVLRGAAHIRPLAEIRTGAGQLAAASRQARSWPELLRSPGGLLDDIARARELRPGGAALVLGAHAVDAGQAGLGCSSGRDHEVGPVDAVGARGAHGAGGRR